MNICNSPDEEISKFYKFNLMRSNLLDFFDNTSIKNILRSCFEIIGKIY